MRKKRDLILTALSEHCLRQCERTGGMALARFLWRNIRRRNIREEVDKSVTFNSGIIIERWQCAVFLSSVCWYPLPYWPTRCPPSARKLETFRLNRGTAFMRRVLIIEQQSAIVNRYFNPYRSKGVFYNRFLHTMLASTHSNAIDKLSQFSRLS